MKQESPVTKDTEDAVTKDTEDAVTKDDAEAAAAKKQVEAAAAKKQVEAAAAKKQAEAMQREFDKSYCVAKGCAITSRRGMKNEGDVVTAGDLGGGKVAFDALIKLGRLVKGHEFT